MLPLGVHSSTLSSFFTHSQQWWENIKWKFPERRRNHTQPLLKYTVTLFYFIINFPNLLLCLTLKLVFIVNMYGVYTLQYQAGEGLGIYPPQVSLEVTVCNQQSCSYCFRNDLSKNLSTTFLPLFKVTFENRKLGGMSVSSWRVFLGVLTPNTLRIQRICKQEAQRWEVLRSFVKGRRAQAE